MAVLVTLFAGVVLGSFLDSFLPNNISNTKKGYSTGYGIGHADGFNEAKKKVEDSNFAYILKTPDDIRTLTGTVVSITKNSFILRIKPINVFGDTASLVDRVIVITSSTTISKIIEKDPKDFQIDLDNFIQVTKLNLSSSDKDEKIQVLPPPSLTRLVRK